ncbi:hypothetical protein ACHAXT_003440 [Thalassiosira profunda]
MERHSSSSLLRAARGLGKGRRDQELMTNASNDLLGLFFPTTTTVPPLVENEFDGVGTAENEATVEWAESKVEADEVPGSVDSGEEEASEDGDEAKPPSTDGSAAAWDAADDAREENEVEPETEAGSEDSLVASSDGAAAAWSEAADAANGSSEADTVTSYGCSGVSRGNADSERTGRLVEYRYDLLLRTDSDAGESGSSNDGNGGAAVRLVEARLLEHVGGALEKRGLCGAAGGGDARLRRRSLAVGNAGGAMLQEVSSLPLDEVKEGAACSDESLPSAKASDEIACYPVTGYMTAYYDENASTADAALVKEVQAVIGDVIQQGLGSDLLEVSDASEESGIAGVRYVESRATSTNPFNGSSQQLASPDEGLSKAAIGGIAGGAAALVLLLCLGVCALRRSKGGKDTAATEGCDSDSEEGRPAASSVVATRDNEADEESSDGYEYGVNSFAEDNSVVAEMEGRRLDSRSRSGQWVRPSMTGATEATVPASNVTAPRRLF